MKMSISADTQLPSILRQSSSLILNGPKRTDILTRGKGKEIELEAVSDSEKEIPRHGHREQPKTPSLRVIEIISDEEDGLGYHDTCDIVDTNRASAATKEQNNSSSQGNGTTDLSDFRRDTTLRTPRYRRIIESSDDESILHIRSGAPDKPTHSPPLRLKTNNDVIDLTVSSSDEGGYETKTISHESPRTPLNKKPSEKQQKEGAVGKILSLYVDDDSDELSNEPWNVDDGSILIFDEPPSARKPIRIPSTPTDVQSTTSRTAPIAFGKMSSTPRKHIGAYAATKTPRTSKRARLAAEQLRREMYARSVFEELNSTVFKGGIPQTTELKWSNRLLTTAGRARWRRSRDGADTTEIELAIKVLDCDERIRNTLSHEMCHLACWIIDKNPNEGHGKFFKSWANKVMRARPEIEVTTKHNYEIAYKYEWRCENCAKIYGRFSKSIRPEECVCGACKIGKLIPQFQSAQRAPGPKSTAGSQLPATRDLPRPKLLEAESDVRGGSVILLDDEAEVLAMTLGEIRLGQRKSKYELL